MEPDLTSIQLLVDEGIAFEPSASVAQQRIDVTDDLFLRRPREPFR
jgi:hypothetical protein